MKTQLLNLTGKFPYGNEAASLIYQSLLARAQPTENGSLTYTFQDTDLAKELELPLYILRPHLTRFHTSNRITVHRDPNDMSLKTITFNTNTDLWLTYREAGELQWDMKVKAHHERLEQIAAVPRRRDWTKPDLKPVPPHLALDALITIIASTTSPKRERIARPKIFSHFTGLSTTQIGRLLRTIERQGHIICHQNGSGRRPNVYVTGPRFHDDFQRYRQDDLDAYLVQLRLRRAEA